MAWTQNASPGRIDRKTIAEGANKYISRAKLRLLFANPLWSRRGDRSTYANLSKRWIGFSEDDGSRSPKAQMLGRSITNHFSPITRELSLTAEDGESGEPLVWEYLWAWE
jgi:hypothetical protein